MALRPRLTLRTSRPTRGLRLRLEPTLAILPAGGRTRFQLRIENGSTEDQDVVLAVDRPGDGWSASIPVRFIRVPANSASVMMLRVDAPKDASLGARATFRVSAAGSGRPDRSSILVAEAVVAQPAP